MKLFFQIFFSKHKISFVLVFISILYFFFPTQNSTLDAYAYAGNISYAEHLFKPHHLLYNAFVYVLKQIGAKAFQSLDVLSFAKIINASFVILSLIVLKKIFRKLDFSENRTIFSLLFVAFSFNVWRFGTENETYILPVFYSILGSFFFLKYYETKQLKHLIWTSFFGSLACLFHQIHFFWWMGLGIGVFFTERRNRNVLWYGLPFLIVPFAYVLVLKYYNLENITASNFIHFVFHDYYGETTQLPIQVKSFFMMIVSSFRVFFQIHPNIYFLIRYNILFILPLFFGLFLIYVLFKKRKIIYTVNKNSNTVFYKTHFYIFIMQMIFALFSNGNVEFMVMIPFLLVLSVLYRFFISEYVLKITLFTLLIWNFTYGIFPNKFFNYYNDEQLTDYIISHPKDYFLVKNDDLMNQYYYKTGIDNYPKIIRMNSLDLQDELNNLLIEHSSLTTDCIEKPTVFNRAQLFSTNDGISFEPYKKTKVFEFKGLYGVTKVYKIENP